MNTTLILAAGSSRRFGRDKLLTPVLGKPLAYYAVQALHDHAQTGRLIIAAASSNKKALAAMVGEYRFPRVVKTVPGGKTRLQSLQRAFRQIEGPKDNDIVIVHNAANPLVTAREITAVIVAARKYGAAAAGRLVTDTIKELKGGRHSRTHDRENLVAAQTPQAARYGILKKALLKAAKQHKEFTDESSLLENIGIRVKHVPASPDNFKITTRHDYEHLKVVMGDVPENYLVGIGQDSHEFSDAQRGLRLGGLTLKNHFKLLADSDGDVILHAIYNALSQAIGEGSLGRIATPALKEKGITDSGRYLRIIQKRIAAKKYALNNLGLMIEAQTPHIDPLAPRLKKSLSGLLGLPARRIGITATSGEKLTAFGRGEGIQCFAIVSLKKNED